MFAYIFIYSVVYVYSVVYFMRVPRESNWSQIRLLLDIETHAWNRFSGNELQPCTFGPRNCHKTYYCRRRQLTTVSTLSDTDQRLLLLRSKLSLHEGATICEHHKELYLRRYASKIASKLCSDPFLRHTKHCHGSTVITIALADAHPSLDLVPGNRICEACRRKLYIAQKDEHTEQEFAALSTRSEGAPARSAAETEEEFLDVATGSERNWCSMGDGSVEREPGQKLQRGRLLPEIGQSSTCDRHEDHGLVFSDYVTLMQDLKEKFSREQSREKKASVPYFGPPVLVS